MTYRAQAISTIATPVDVSGIASTVTVDPNPPTAASSYAVFGSVTGNPVEIVAPSANVNGVKVFGAWCGTTSSSALARIMYKQSAPSTASDTAAGTLAVARGTTGTLPDRGIIGLPIIVPAGYGIYEGATDNNAHDAFLDYEVL